MYKCVSILYISLIVISSVILLFKSQVAYNHRIKIIKAMLQYSIRYDTDLNYGNIESYEETLYRFFDWSDKNILKDKDLYNRLKSEGLV